MEMTDRPHHHHHRATTSNNNASATTGGELFICFTSRLSSSMKLPSKSILSPARQPDSSSSASSSLTRRPSLRNGQASPMFPPTTSTAKKRGCAGGFDNPEPTSPKVTCIGQVRVKTKAKKSNILLPNRSNKPTSTQLSFRKIDPSNNNLDMAAAHLHHQECRKWVHFPVTICEALRAIGTEFNCFLPCRSSCMPNHNKQDKASSDAGGSGAGGESGSGSGSSCGAAVLARWLVAAVQQQEEGERRGGRQIELVVGDEEEEEEEEEVIIRSSHRRHVFEDVEINLCEKEKEREQGSGVSICIPPKNALLLMRCRSDPLKMAALANRSWEPSLPSSQHCVMEEEDEDDKAAAAYLRKQEPEIEQRECSEELSSSCEKLVVVEQKNNLDQKEGEPESSLDKEQDEDFLLQGLEDPRLVGTTAHESPAESGQHDVEIAAAQGVDDTAHESPEESPLQFVEECKALVSGSEQEENGFYKVEAEQTTAAELESEPELETVSAKHFDDTNYSSEQEFVQGLNEEASASNEETEKTEENGGPEPPDPEENGSKQEEKLLPDCLLLMMCEPKLSMEVSKETWVCSRDFIRWQPQQKQRAVKVKRKDGDPDEDDSKRRIRKPVLLQPPRSSCSLPVAPPRGSVARMIEQQKLVDGGGKGCEPFVLTRCKSEPMRSAADSCSWKNRKLEPATVGVGAAGVGF